MDEKEQKEYQSPTLVEYGDIEEITKGGKGGYGRFLSRGSF